MRARAGVCFSPSDQSLFPFFHPGSTAPTMVQLHAHRLGRRGKAVGFWQWLAALLYGPRAYRIQ
jgi:hypothetical protein